MTEFDPKSTEPGGVAPTPEKTVAMKCKAENCSSMQAVEVEITPSVPGQGAIHNRLYRCIRCHTTFGISVGGYCAL